MKPSYLMTDMDKEEKKNCISIDLFGGSLFAFSQPLRVPDIPYTRVYM